MRFISPGFWGRLQLSASVAVLGLASLACSDAGDEVISGSGSGASGGMGATTSTGGTMSGGSGGVGNVGGSGGSGTGGTGGVSPTLELKGPVERGGELVLEFGDTYVSIRPSLGGRVTSLRQAGTEILAGPAIHPDNWGSTYWTSPQSDWDWPPVAAIDNEPYQATVTGPSVSLSSAPADVGEEVGGKNVTVQKRFTADLVREAIDVEYTLTNVGSSAISLASWEISRVPGGGLTFYPTGDQELTPIAPHEALPVTHLNQITWFDGASFSTGQNSKLNADGKGGWLAHVAGGVLFLKTFTDLPVSSQVPGEGEVEIYAHGTGSYVEVENQGPAVTIQPGASSTYGVTWLVRKVPAGVTVAVGSDTLVSFVESLLE